MASQAEPIRCPQCSSTFRRQEHLRRHQLSHNDERQHNCVFCTSAFKRRDVLRKHMKSCVVRNTNGLKMPHPVVSGKKLHACDQCASTKRACDSGMPCSECVRKSKTCTTHRMGSAYVKRTEPCTIDFATPKNVDSSNFEFMDPYIMSDFSQWHSLTSETSLELNSTFNQMMSYEMMSDFHTTSDLDTISSFDMISDFDIRTKLPITGAINQPFRFLLNMTQVKGLNTVFNFDRQPRYQEAAGGINNHNEPPKSGMAQETQQRTEKISSIDIQNGFGIAHVVRWLEDPLFPQAKEIWEKFRVARSQRISCSVGQPSAEDQEHLLEFFSPFQLRWFLDMFWEKWNSHCPIIHRASFDASKVSYLLVASMATIGACLSSNEHRLQALEILDTLEDLVFQNDLFQDDTCDFADEELSMQLLQASYFVCLLQNWEGDDKAKKRVRQERFTTMVAAARMMDISRAKHNWQQYVTSPGYFDWQEFSRKESMIRTFTYIFLLDTAFVAINKSPPRMVIQEMDTDLPDSDAAFQAPTSESCLASLSVLGEYRGTLPPQLLLREAVQAMTQPDFESETRLKFDQMNVLSLFTVISAFHSIVFQLASSFHCLPMVLSPIRIALDRWKSIWDSKNYDAASNSAAEAWQDLGFFKHAHEFWLLATAGLGSIEDSNKTPTRSIPELEKNKTTRSKHAPSQHGLDDSSMRQITEMMIEITVNGRVIVGEVFQQDSYVY